MTELINPTEIHKPASSYSHVAVTPPGARWVHVSGQIGIDAAGRTAEGFAAQAEQAWRNVLACLAAGRMDLGDIVKVTTYLVDPAHVPESRAIRARFLGDHAPASTLVIVRALAGPAWLVEIEAVAAKRDPGPRDG